MKDYYRILNVTKNATDDDIKRSYRVLAKRYHPDVTNGEPASQKRFQDINEAYDVLSDPQKRSAYDAQINRQEAEQYWKKQREAFIAADASLAAQFQEIFNQGYQEGYLAGFNSVSNDKNIHNLEAKIHELNTYIAKLKADGEKVMHDRGDLEQELFARDKELTEITSYSKDLESKLQWLKDAINIDTTQMTDPLNDKATETRATVEQLKKEIESYKVDPDELAENITTLAQQERRKEIREELIRLNREVNKLMNELNDIKSIEDQKRSLSKSDAYLKSMEERAETWAKKVRRDRQLAKPTYYGALGILIWATQKEIDEAYERLFKKYTEQDDEAGDEMLRHIKRAYATLAKPDDRAKYNRSIGFTEEMIASERKLAADNARMQAEYHSKLAAKAFWARFDDLSSLALSGDADAQNALGEIYYKGVNIAQDYAHAAYWFREAFEQGHPAAIYNLGVCYHYGRGVERNDSLANSLFRQAKNLSYKPSGDSPRIE